MSSSRSPAANGGVILSIVCPVYLAEDLIDDLVVEIERHVLPMGVDFEIVLVEDGSPDASWAAIVAAGENRPHLRGFRLSRNFGQNYAITAGLASARGEYTVVMDCDLQDDPRYIPKLLEKAREGADIVYTVKDKRRHKGLKNLLGRLFHRILNALLTDERLATQSSIGNYLIMRRKVRRAFLSINDYHRQFLGVMRWIGFDAEYLEIEHRERPSGPTSYTISKLMREAVNGIASQSYKLLYASVFVGLSFFLVSIGAAAYIVIAYFLAGFQEGWASVMVLILVSTGTILMALGVTGIYLGKLFDQAKHRPLYIIRETVNDG